MIRLRHANIMLVFLGIDIKKVKNNKSFTIHISLRNSLILNCPVFSDFPKSSTT